MTDGSPSGGWRSVYAAMGVSTDHEAPACPDCGDDTVEVATGRWCPTHGVVGA
ncbi:hypothetical protein [Halosegnis marinus]|uniref:Small CPxCG-related zinc finger protein n=1 Tax=Halosegnis marinus TaxID=3034023 RepID=A0ABD5ZRX8_9EURY|nr:hypothetical protein [Halosegnis sp. DT85]